jgi:nitrogen fixation/metabolism regulation signal transduction histidine kinase
VKELRQRNWIDPFQTGLLIRIGFYLLMYQVVAWAFFTLSEQVNAALTGLGAAPASPRSILLRCFLAFLVLLPFLTIDAIRFAHRLVGPLYRFRKTLQAIAAGEPVELVQLRKGDLLQDFKEDFNTMLKHLEQKGAIVLKTPEAVAKAETPQTIGGTAPAAGC